MRFYEMLNSLQHDHGYSVEVINYIRMKYAQYTRINEASIEEILLDTRAYKAYLQQDLSDQERSFIAGIVFGLRYYVGG